MNTKLRDALSSASMSQSELGRRLGIHPSQVNRWLHRKLRPTWPQLINAAQALDVDSVEDLGYTLKDADPDVLDYA